jgi:hypothetical protein
MRIGLSTLYSWIKGIYVMRSSKNMRIKAAYALLCSGALLLGGTQMAVASSDGNGSHQGMNPDNRMGMSVDSGKVSGAKDTDRDNRMSAEQGESDSAKPHAHNSTQGMSPNQHGMQMSTDSAAMSKDQRKSEK